MTQEQKESIPMPTLDSLQMKAARFLVAWMWLHVALIGVIAPWTGRGGWPDTLVAAAFAGLATLLWRTRGVDGLFMSLAAVGMMVMVSLLVKVVPASLQIDLHMYYFATLAMLAVFCDWRPIVAATGLVAVHHLALNFLWPLAVFPDGGDIVRVLVHAVILVAEAAVLVVLTTTLRSMFQAVDQAMGEAQANLASAETARQAAELAAERERQSELARRAQDERALAERAAHEAQVRADADSERRRTLDALATRFEADVGRVADALDQSVDALRAAAQTMSDETRQATARSTAVAAASRDAGADVDTVAAAAEELAAAVREIATRTEEAARIAGAANVRARATETRVVALDQASGTIGDVVDLISEIAGQTNLLALNATIEAARAGDAGRGFAVVASEVKALATQTGNATGDISRQVRMIQDASTETLGDIGSIGQIIAELDAFATGIAGSLTQQQAATQDIARAVQSAATGTRSVASNVEAVTHALAGTEAATAAVARSAESLAVQTKALKGSLGTFLGHLRAA
jgi:methyl-accepting chemotaxis protein